MTASDLEPKYTDNKYDYDLSDDEKKHLILELLEEREPTGNQSTVCYQLDAANPQDAKYTNIARTLERTRFERRFGNTTDIMHEEYGPWEKQSIFFLAIDMNTAETVSALRAIHDGPNGFKTPKDLGKEFGDSEYEKHIFEHYGITDPSTCWDLGTAAADEGHPGGAVWVYRGMYVGSQKAGIKHFFSMVDEKPFETMEKLGFPFKPLDGANWMAYAGSKKSLPVYGDAPTFEASVREQEKAISDNPVMQRIIGSALGQLGRGTKDDSLQF